MNGLDLVAIRITHKSGIISCGIGAQSGFSVTLATSFDGCLVEGIDGGLIRCRKGNMDAVADGGSLTVFRQGHPEAGIIDTIGGAEIERLQTAVPQRGQNRIIERS